MLLKIEARSCHTRIACASYGAVERVHSKFGEFCVALEKLYGVQFRHPSTANYSCPCEYVSRLKKFCGGLLEGVEHEWRYNIRRLSRRQRFSIAASLFLFRKIIPSSGVDLDAYMDKMSTHSDKPDPGFVRFCETEVEKIFRVGWDRNYMRLPERVILPRSSCTERGMSQGGQRALAAMSLTWLSQQSLIEYCKYGKRPLKLGPSRVVAVETGGKARIVSTPTIEMNVLRPLHIAMYDHLSKFPWLLRGDATRKRFKDFTRVDGEVFVSGDYESATDNLNHHIQELLLRKVCDQTTRVPVGIRDVACSSLSMLLTDKTGRKTVVQNRGQLMGNLLSFPLLCLVNFLGFKYFVNRNVPLKINGDDIVFRARPSEAKRWLDGVGRSGLTLSKGKTLVNSKFFSLNSRFFESGRSVRLVPVVRSKGLFGGGTNAVMSLRDRFRSSSEGFSAKGKSILLGQFLLRNKKYILASRRSVRNGLRIPATREHLAEAGLLYREMCYFEPASASCPRYIREEDISDALKPQRPYGLEGWELRRVPWTPQVKEWQKEHGRLTVVQSWIEPFISEFGGDEAAFNEYIKSVIIQTGYDFSRWISTMKKRLMKSARMMGLSRNTLWSWLKSTYGSQLPPITKRPKCSLFYCPTSEPAPRITFSRSVDAESPSSEDELSEKAGFPQLCGVASASNSLLPTQNPTVLGA